MPTLSGGGGRIHAVTLLLQHTSVAQGVTATQVLPRHSRLLWPGHCHALSSYLCPGPRLHLQAQATAKGQWCPRCAKRSEPHASARALPSAWSPVPTLARPALLHTLQALAKRRLCHLPQAQGRPHPGTLHTALPAASPKRDTRTVNAHGSRHTTRVPRAYVLTKPQNAHVAPQASLCTSVTSPLPSSRATTDGLPGTIQWSLSSRTSCS